MSMNVGLNVHRDHTWLSVLNKIYFIYNNTLTTGTAGPSNKQKYLYKYDHGLSGTARISKMEARVLIVKNESMAHPGIAIGRWPIFIIKLQLFVVVVALCVCVCMCVCVCVCVCVSVCALNLENMYT